MKVAILGYGTVGRGVYKMIADSSFLENGPVLRRPEKCTESFNVSDIKDIVSDSTVDTVVECMGGIEPAFSYVKASLECKKNVVTSNKALVVAKGIELQKIAMENGVAFLFSAACGGAIPVLSNLVTASRTDNILNVKGILNGTTNFILTKMADEGLSYSKALSMAKELGYAESDPTSDVSGMDTMRKVLLVSAVSFDKLPVSGYNVEGIENIVSCIPEGYQVRLLGSCGLNSDGSVFAFVQPSLVENGSILSSVKANFNMAIYEGERCGRISLGGQGAGMYPTASAVLRDLTDISISKKYMFSSGLSETKANNSMKKFRYFVVEDSSAREVETDVSSMFALAAGARQKGREFFFAAYER